MQHRKLKKQKKGKYANYPFHNYLFK